MSWSLRKRFLLTSLGVSAAVLLAAGVFLYILFERDFRARVQAETHNQLMQLVSGLDVERSGDLIKTQPMTDPRFRQPSSGLYWQVESKSGKLLRSRSLWDSTLTTGSDPWRDIDQPEAFAGPFGEPVLIHAKLISLGEGAGRQQYRVMIAVNESEVTQPTLHFAVNLYLSLLVLGLAMMVLSSTQLGMVMSPISSLRKAVGDIREGKEARVSGTYPVEIEPVVDTLNSLLEQREEMVERARSRAGNFAHSLKTPLTVIDTLLPALSEGGQHATAGEIGRQTAQLRKHADRELTRARMAAGHGEPVRDVKAVLEEIVRTIRHLPRGGDIAFVLHVPPRLGVRMDREDFIEMIANVLDNARKWAKSQVVIRLEPGASEHLLSISDDGPGIPAADIDKVVERGRRLDEATEGTGIGLAIVNDISDACNLRTSFSASETGGLRFAVSLPATAGR
ncbi:MAG: HAMP domain-containing sensor histidine kinase [Hyphomicrobiales bacterium]